MFLGHVFVEDTAPAVVKANEKLDSWFTDRSFPSGTYLAIAAAVATAAGPFMRRSWRRTAWVGVGAAAVLRLLTAAEVPINLATGLAIGCLAGSSRSCCSARRRSASTPTWCGRSSSDAGWTPARSPRSRETGARPRSSPHWLTVVPTSGCSGGRSATPTSSCAPGGHCASRASATTGLLAQHGESPRTPRWPRASPRPPVRVPTVLGVAATDVEGAMLLIDEYVDGVPLSAMTGDEIGDDLLADVWRQVDALRRRRIAHRWLDAKHVRVRDGAAVIVDFRSAVTAAQELLSADVVELLASTSALVGVPRAVAAAHDVLGPRRWPTLCRSCSRWSSGHGRASR